MGELAWLNSAAVDAGEKVLASDPDGEPQRGQRAVRDHSIDGVLGDAQKAGCFGTPTHCPSSPAATTRILRDSQESREGPARHHPDGGSRRTDRHGRRYVPSLPGEAVVRPRTRSAGSTAKASAKRTTP